MTPPSAAAVPAGLVHGLAACASFEAAARVLARAALARVAAATEGVAGVEVLRAAVHLRPDEGYRGLVVEERSAADAGAGAPATSGTAWEAVRHRARPVALDVMTGELSAPSGAPLAGEAPRTFPSRMELLRRSTTHLLAVPLVRPGGAVLGMLVVEVAARAAIGCPLPAWAAVVDGVALDAAVAGPWLAALPQQLDEAVLADELLPVVGARMAPVVRMLEVFGRFDQTLLLRGPTGTGKSHLARRCHARSGRSAAPFVTVSLHALPESLREAELFGWRRGAFTGAHADHTGAVERAGEGTLFIDEIDKLPRDAQSRLLRLLEERRYAVLGETTERTARARFIVGTNADLEAAVQEGRFLEDLYYRINVLPVALPPLRERRDEIGGWARHMLAQLAPPAEDPPVLARAGGLALEAAAWPGNLRQLNSVVVRAYALACMEQGAVGARVSVDGGHVERAIAMEGRSTRSGLAAALDAAAEAAVTEALQRREAGAAPLDIEQLDVLKGLVLGRAVRDLGDEREACRLFGMDRLVQWSNHRKVIRREHARVAGLYAALGLPTPPAPLAEGD